MRVLRLPRVAELGDVRVSPSGTKTGSKPKPWSPAGASAIAPFEHAGAAELGALGRERDELADIARARDRLASTAASGFSTWRPSAHAPSAPRATAERCDLDPGVVREHPAVRRADAAAEAALMRALSTSLAVLRREVPATSSSSSQSGKSARELVELVRVARAERADSGATGRR